MLWAAIIPIYSLHLHLQGYSPWGCKSRARLSEQTLMGMALVLAPCWHQMHLAPDGSTQLEGSYEGTSCIKKQQRSVVQEMWLGITQEPLAVKSHWLFSFKPPKPVSLGNALGVSLTSPSCCTFPPCRKAWWWSWSYSTLDSMGALFI